ncbi:MAG: glycosyl hydrolase family 18 protein [Thermodesulfobacteriota bacterium]
MNSRFLLGFSLVVSLLILVACGRQKEYVRPGSIGSWVVYWDGLRGMKELETYGNLFDRVSLFGFEIGEDGKPQSAPGLQGLIPRFIELSKEKGFSPWVTLVNDWRGSEKVILKETTTLGRILSDNKERRKQVRAIVDLVAADGFSGLDLDYEGFSNRDRPFLDPFISELSAELKKKGLGFTVVVEPRKDRYLPPTGTVSLIVMGYNLHGPHNGPGPRATPKFLRSLRSRGQGDTSGKPVLALAVGGFVWGKNNKVKPLDWKTGNEQGEKAPEKGRGTGDVPYARLGDGSLIWYDDPKSLAAKWKASADGFKGLMIWRLGGNDDRLFHWLGTLKK